MILITKPIGTSSQERDCYMVTQANAKFLRIARKRFHGDAKLVAAEWSRHDYSITPGEIRPIRTKEQPCTVPASPLSLQH